MGGGKGEERKEKEVGGGKKGRVMVCEWHERRGRGVEKVVDEGVGRERGGP